MSDKPSAGCRTSRAGTDSDGVARRIFPALATPLPPACQNVPVSHGARKHAGSRKASRSARPSRQRDPKLAVYAVGMTFCIVAWGYLVWAAIDFGATARGGTQSAWFFLMLACVGAASCLFAGLILGVRLLTVLGVVAPPAGSPEAEARPVGGRRAAR